jgi:hypothetical protein
MRNTFIRIMREVAWTAVIALFLSTLAVIIALGGATDVATVLGLASIALAVLASKE